ncbi:MAG: CBS domain-containing protein [Candidatus Polarisedimenticolia bacterium]
MVCPGCGHDNIQGAFTCEGCGTDLAGFDLYDEKEHTGLGRHILHDPVKNAGPLKPLVAATTATIWDAIRIMREGRHGSVLVVDRGSEDRLVGIFTERDVLTRVWGAGLDINATPVARVMTAGPVTLTEDSSIAHAIHLMAMKGFRHIPIVRENRPIGFVSVRGILKYIADQVLAHE